MPEFTGERLVPGQVEPDLWNEHYARYLFAKRLARNKRVLDIACGHGYGSAELAKAARHVVGIDISAEAVETAAREYQAHNLRFEQASAVDLPFSDASFDLITAFEVIEHLNDWSPLLREAKRLLAPGGQCIVSTPNRLYYAESRKKSGPNPYHLHEFEFEEFRQALLEHFPSVRLYLQNHVQATAFEPLNEPQSSGEILVEPSEKHPEDSHFFVAVCALSTQTGGPTFVYLPSTANVLREREKHIEKLEGELGLKDAWLERLKSEHAELTRLHTQQLVEMKQQAEWAHGLEEELEKARAHILAQDEHIRALGEQAAALQAGYEAVRSDNDRLNRELAEKVSELREAVDLLHKAEDDLEQRTKWALSLEERIAHLEGVLQAAGNSKWLRLGRSIGIGPALPTG